MPQEDENKIEVESAQEQSQTDGDLENRVQKLERYVEILESVMKVQTTSVEFETPVYFRNDSVNLNGAQIRSGTGVPSHTPSVGSIWMRLDGGGGTTLYVYEAGGWNSLS